MIQNPSDSVVGVNHADGGIIMNGLSPSPPSQSSDLLLKAAAVQKILISENGDHPSDSQRITVSASPTTKISINNKKNQFANNSFSNSSQFISFSNDQLNETNINDHDNSSNFLTDFTQNFNANLSALTNPTQQINGVLNNQQNYSNNHINTNNSSNCNGKSLFNNRGNYLKNKRAQVSFGQFIIRVIGSK
jgi:hypothetical protein